MYELFGYVAVVIVLTNDSFVRDCALITNCEHNTFVCAHLVLTALNRTVSEFPLQYINSNTSNYNTDVAIDPILKLLDISSSADKFEDHMERCEFWCMNGKDINNDGFTAYLLVVTIKET